MMAYAVCEGRQFWLKPFRMVSAARQRGALRRIPDAIFLIGVPAMRVGRHRAGNRACLTFLTRAALVATFANHSAT